MGLPSQQDLVIAGAAAFVVAVICWFFGVDVWHAVLLGCAVTVAGLAGHGSRLNQAMPEVSWRSRRESRTAGSRSDILNLSLSLRSNWGTVSPTAERRLIVTARRRLALEGLDLRNPEHRAAIEARIGPGAVRVFTHEYRGKLSLRTLIGCLDALDGLNGTYYPAPQIRSRWPGANLTLRRKEPHA